MKFLGNTHLIILITLLFSACSEQSTEEALTSTDNLIHAVEANAKIAPAKAMEEMKLEVEETADKITDEISLATPNDSTATK